MKLPHVAFASRTLKKQKPLLKGTDIRKLQQVLKGMGFLDSRVDGVFGHGTAQAVVNFQRTFKIKSKGVVDQESFTILHNLISSKPLYWSTSQRDFAHTGFHPLSLTSKLKVSWTKPISQIISLNSRGDRIIITTEKGVIAINIYDGKGLWENRDVIPLGAVTLSDMHVLVPSHELNVIDFYTGKTLESIDIDKPQAFIATKGNKIFASRGGSVYSYKHNGIRLWKYGTTGVLVTPPTLGYDLVYFSSYDRHIYCVDAKGLLYWKTKTPDIVHLPLGLWDDKIFAISKDSWIYALNPLMGDIIWRKKFSDEEFLMPAFCQDYMLLFNYQGEGFALNPRSGDILWSMELETTPSTPPVVCDKLFFIGTSEGLVAFVPETATKIVYLEGEKIVALLPVGFDLYVATSQSLIKFSPEKL